MPAIGHWGGEERASNPKGLPGELFSHNKSSTGLPMQSFPFHAFVQHPFSGKQLNVGINGIKKGFAY